MNVLYIGSKPSSVNCPYLRSEEDHWRTTIYPVCKCAKMYCNEYKGYCPIRDD